MRRTSHKFFEQQPESSKHSPTTWVLKRRIVKTKVLWETELRGNGASVNFPSRAMLLVPSLSVKICVVIYLKVMYAKVT
jgi:hypothetical protein